jgi:hypothetical protein
MSRPSVLAVLRLITSSYLVGACTGKSAVFSPNEISQTPPYPPANNVFDALIVHDAEIPHRLAHASQSRPARAILRSEAFLNAPGQVRTPAGPLDANVQGRVPLGARVR